MVDYITGLGLYYCICQDLLTIHSIMACREMILVPSEIGPTKWSIVSLKLSRLSMIKELPELKDCPLFLS